MGDIYIKKNLTIVSSVRKREHRVNIGFSAFLAGAAFFGGSWHYFGGSWPRHSFGESQPSVHQSFFGSWRSFWTLGLFGALGTFLEAHGLGFLLGNLSLRGIRLLCSLFLDFGLLGGHSGLSIFLGLSALSWRLLA